MQGSGLSGGRGVRVQDGILSSLSHFAHFAKSREEKASVAGSAESKCRSIVMH